MTDIDTLKTDYVVEQGTSGYWHYRLWESGFVELYGAKTVSVSMTNWGSLSYTGVQLGTLPFTLATVYASTATVWSGTVSVWSGGMMNDGTIRAYSQGGAGGPHSITFSRTIFGKKQ